MMVNTKALERMAQMCHEEELENYIDLCDKTIDKLLAMDDEPRETLDYVRSYRGLIREFEDILESIREEE